MQQFIKKDIFRVFDLNTLFSGYTLLVNVSTLIISLLPLNRDADEYVIAQRLLTEGEMRMLLPLLDFPSGCQQAVLKASYDCTYTFLLQSLPLSDLDVNPQWHTLVQAEQERLHRAQEKKAMRSEMRGVYNALFSLRQKLEPLGLTVRSRRDGYSFCKVDT